MLSFSKILCDGKSAVSLDVRMDNVHEITDTIQLDGNGYCFLADKKGNIIAHRDENQISKNYMTDSAFDGTDIRKLMEKVLASSGTCALQNIKLDGNDTMVFTQNVMNECYVVLVVKSCAVFRETQSSLAHCIASSLFIFIVVCYFCTSNYINRKRAIQYAENIRIDDLTGLNNRGEFDRYINTAINDILMDKKTYLLLFDADKFKHINDTYGHPEGDNALRLIAKALMSICHGTDWFCARYGGDEFVIICRCVDESVVTKIIDDVNLELKIMSAENNLPYRLSLSCGYACNDSSALSIAELVDIADRNLYGAKGKRNR